MSTQSRLLRAAAVAAAAFLLMGNICNRGNDEPTPTPTRAPTLESIDEFQLVARVVSVLPIAPNLDLPPLTPGPTPLGEMPPEPGAIEVEIADLSEELVEECELEPGDVVDLNWTRLTGFDPPEILNNLEEDVEERIVAALGTIFRQRPPAGGGIPGLLPTATPTDECILVADQILLVEEGAPLRTPRPRTQLSPSPTATRSPVPSRTPRPPTRTAQS